MSIRTLLSLLLAVILVAACGQAETNAQGRAGTEPPGATPTRPNPGTARDGAVVLEFDLPDEFRTVPEGAPDAVAGFRVGYFRASDPAAIRTMDVEREALAVQGRTGRVTLSSDAVAVCAVDCVIRLQTLSGGRASAWSEPVPLVDRAAAAQAQPKPQPAQPARAARNEPPRTAVPRTAAPRPRGNSLTPGDLEPYSVLTETLRKLLPPDVSLEAELQRFRRVTDLALAVAISRDYDIPFTALSGALVGPPRLTARNALAKLRPDVDVRGAIRKSRAEAGQLTAAAKDPGVATDD
jgi:hypothetical protein